MKEAQFSEWLEANGAISATSIDTRIYALRSIENKLKELGFDYPDLEAAWDASRLEDIRQALGDLATDFDAGGQRYRLLFPQGENPRKRLATWRSWLGRYAKFLAGEGVGTQDADRIRAHVLEHYIEPARAADQDQAELVVKEVNDSLGLNQAWPNICQALRGRRFQALAEVPPPQSFGADMSTATRFRFDLDRADYWALVSLRKRYGEPLALTKKMASFQLSDGRQIALDLEAPKAQLWLEGAPAIAGVKGASSTSYAANAPRHSNLPSRLKPTGADARPVSVITALNAEALTEVLDVYGEDDGAPFDKEALNQLRQRFLAQFPDFESAGGFPGTSRFKEDEDAYKRALIERASELIAQHQNDPAQLGAALLDLIADKTDLESDLLGWRMADGLAERRRDHPDLLETAAANIATTADPRDGVMQFIEQTWSAAFATEGNNPYGDSRTIPTVVAAIAEPDQVIAIRTDRFNNLFEALLGKKLFAWAPLSLEELDRAIDLARQIFVVMRDEWGWQPRDLWDVQGFIWVTCEKKLKAGAGDMTDIDLLARFDKSDLFRAARSEWPESETKAFCEIARAFHDAGFDWWFVNIPAAPVRFGRKSPGRKQAEGVQGYLYVSPPHIWFNEKGNAVDLDLDDFAVEPEALEPLREALIDNAAKIAAWHRPNPPRAGLWPDEGPAEDGEVEESSTKSHAKNLILYGPPGTGKTYTTMSRAVEMCGEVATTDRPALRQQYERLQKEGRIEFVTFHQNFAYEEFVEGLRPKTDQPQEEGQAGAGFRLEPEPGIFRRLCTLAEEATKSAATGQPFDVTGRKVFKMSLGRAGIEDDIFEDAWNGGYIVLGWDGEIDWSGFTSYQAIFDRWNADSPSTHGSDSNIAQVNRFVVDMQPGDLVVISYGNTKIRAIGEVTGPYEFAPTGVRNYNHRRKVRWLRRFEEPVDASLVSSTNFMQNSCYLINNANLNRSGLATLLPGEGGASEAPKQYVLIIDEINRANVSKVFGELITLIEPDKRLGMEHALRVRLPYSKKEFGVPSNLHILGTMNTADRSIALLDSALRRRFQFVEMAPDTTVKEFVDAEKSTGLPLSDMLQAMNDRIEYLVGRDQRIGHAFFIGCESKKDVDRVMVNKVIPLLQEYFFEDWSQLAAVLGEAGAGGNFLECRKIDDPMGKRDAAKSWRVRSTLESVNYGRIISGAGPSTNPGGPADDMPA